jgi:hypothetical protein
LQKGTLARAVLTDDAKGFAGADFEADVAQGRSPDETESAEA